MGFPGIIIVFINSVSLPNEVTDKQQQFIVVPMKTYPGVEGQTASYPPPPIMQQPINPYTPIDAFYRENLPAPIVQPTGDPSQALQFLRTATSLQICQKFEIMEIITGFETENKYTIVNETGQPVFHAVEKSDCCARQCCGPSRPMEVRIFDIYQNEILHLNRPLACSSVCCFCCLQKMEISSPPGKIISTLEQRCSLWPMFDVKDAVGNCLLQIDGPFCTFSCGSDVKFSIKSMVNGEEIGSISKKWGGFMAEAFTDADNFAVSFPSDLSIEYKMALLGAVFLIDMMYYENAQKK